MVILLPSILNDDECDELDIPYYCHFLFTLYTCYNSRGSGGMANQAASGMQAAFGNMQQQVQKAAVNAAASAAAAEVEKQMTAALRGGFRK